MNASETWLQFHLTPVTSRPTLFFTIRAALRIAISQHIPAADKDDLRHPLLFLIHPPNLLRTSQQQKAHNTCNQCQGTKEQCDRSPRLQAVMFLSMSANAVIYQIRNHTESSVGRLPEKNSRGMFFSPIPSSDDEDEAG